MSNENESRASEVAEVAGLRNLLTRMIDEQAVEAAKLTRALATTAGDAPPIVLWSAAVTVALLAMRNMEDSAPSDDYGFAKQIVADLKAQFIAQLMTRDAKGL